MLIVENDPAKVEADLAAGRVACPGCGYVLGPWSFARRRFVPRRNRPARGAPVVGTLPGMRKDPCLAARFAPVPARRRNCCDPPACRRRRRERAVLEQQHLSAVPSRPSAVGCGASGPRRPGWRPTSRSGRTGSTPTSVQSPPPPRCSQVPWKQLGWPPGRRRCASGRARGRIQLGLPLEQDQEVAE